MTEEALKLEIQEALAENRGRFPVSKISPRLARGIMKFQEREQLGAVCSITISLRPLLRLRACP